MLMCEFWYVPEHIEMEMRPYKTNLQKYVP